MENKKKYFLVLLLLSISFLSMLFFGFLLYGEVSSYFGVSSKGFAKTKFYIHKVIGKSKESFSKPEPPKKINASYIYEIKESSNSKPQNEISKQNPKTEEETKPRAKPVKLIYKNADAKAVFLKGTFSVWQPIEMKRNDSNWETTVYLFEGRYKYRFEVDGKEILDPLAILTSGENSVLVVE